MLVEWCPECKMWTDDDEIELAMGRIRHSHCGAPIDYIQIAGLPERVKAGPTEP